MNTEAVIIGTHARFFRDGVAFTVPTAGTAGRNAVPGDADTAWIDLGVISEGGVERVGDEKEVWAPSPGRLQLYDVLTTKEANNFSFKCEELSLLALEALFGAAALTAQSTDFDLLEAVPLKGWLEIKYYNQKNELLLTVLAFVHMKVNGEVSFGDDIARVTFQARTLQSSLNKGTLGSGA
jgi:hypothetical protein